MYRSVYYDAGKECMHLFGWDEDGKREVFQCSYNPYLYIETKSDSDKESLFGTKLRKRSFKKQSDRRKWVEGFSSNRIFENIPPDQQFLIDRFENHYDSDEMTRRPLKVLLFDIETYSPNGFPEPETALDKINVITVHDSLRNKFISWGTKRLDRNIKNCEFHLCVTESELLQKFINYIEDDYPDVISGWNSEIFDVPYIINRVMKILGQEYVDRLSPVKNVYSINRQGQFGNIQTRWFISGVACIDYLDIYKKFSLGVKESYKLDNIGEVELGENKVDYGNQQLHELADNDWQTFVEYNVQDVNLLVRLEEKLRYIELLRMLSYIGLTTLEKAMGTVGIVTGSIVIQARKQGKIIPTFKKDSDALNAKYEGAYVGEPERGFQDAVVSFDANSLYPNTMISLNLSPETKLGTITSKDEDKIYIRDISNKVYDVSRKKFSAFIRDNKIAISRANVLFSQSKKGIVPYIVDRLYKQRKELKDKLLETKLLRSKCSDQAEMDVLDSRITRLNDKQMCLKIYLNSIYGYFGNKHAPMGDPDIARSITLTGQAVIKQSNKILQQYVRSETGKDINPVIYNDTDSSYITIQPLLEARGLKIHHNNVVPEQVHTEVQNLEDYLNEHITSWAQNDLNSADSRFVFKRECISDVGMFLEKKRYVLHVLDDEGIPVDKVKYTGVEVVRSTIPAPVKPAIKNIIETMLFTKSKHSTDNAFLSAYDKYRELPIEDIAFVVGISNYEKYASQCNGFNTVKRMPVHVKAAYYYNTLLKELNIDTKYEAITAGEKMRYYYVITPNRFNISVIGYKYYIPDEFKQLFTPDVEKMFGKNVYSVIERFYNCTKWSLHKPNEQLQTDIFDLLKV